MRWELCKIWKCRVDDPIFTGINQYQWAWYARMILEEKNNEYERNIDLIEYLASFWNYEAVKAIQDARSMDERHSFASDREFEEQVKSGDFKDNEYLDAVRIAKENTNLNVNSDQITSSDRFRVPRSIASLRKIIEDDG